MQMVADRVIAPLATPALFFEYESVLKRPEQLRFSGLSIAGIEAALAAFASAIEPVEVRFAWRPQLPDPDDEMVFDAAINGRAEALITHNIADFSGAASRFNLALLTPAQALKKMVS